MPAWQVLLLQHPLGHAAGVHKQEPFTHSWPARHWTQVTPLVPHAWLVLPGSQTLLWQQPAQLVVVQTHDPF